MPRSCRFEADFFIAADEGRTGLPGFVTAAQKQNVSVCFIGLYEAVTWIVTILSGR
jgi:hypothetical protein